MSEKRCPYPGLRPFTEEEAIFFKGRDLHVRQIIKQLENNKIVMVTGASGDGKSSLVYAGVIPNARAGFFRAIYNNWIIADFRPERSPLKNLSQVIASHLNFDFPYVYEEMTLGFSSLVKLYKSSPFFIDNNTEEWQNSTPRTQRERKQNAANLLILADQFEEFFTNSENFSNGIPSEEAYITVNLLLETYRLALEENLPIYIVCTMRSDYISQCVSFKGLPETIGFSQFFVPRLKRNELQQIIEEPALLSGGTVSKRLVEVLINELKEGFDQLPVLQHALNQLWKYANNGENVLDLKHLAMLAGLQHTLVPNEDKAEFSAWLQQLEKHRREYFNEPTIGNVLNAHANLLYHEAFNNFLNTVNWAEKNISEEDAHLIIKISFLCLTKIDEGRGVRNRMTINEIAQILNKPHISPEIICGVLNIFRLPNNSFIRPFIDVNDIETQYLSGNTVLDITHEALIRNWQLLGKWEDEEYDHLANFKDFKIQLLRWVDSGFSKHYLLTLGNLTHYETWFAETKPNKYWIARYDTEFEPEYRIEKAEETFQNTVKFLEASRNFITKTEKAKRRRKNIVLIASLLVSLILLGFTYWALNEKSIADEQRNIAEVKTQQAEDEKNKVIKAQEQLELEKQRAEENAQAAILAKLKSDSLLLVARKMRLLAEEKTLLANSAAEEARLEKIEAEKQKIIAEEQRLIAEKQRILAVQTSDTAQKLSYLAVAQSLALKASNNYNSMQTNLLLALQAYRFNAAYGGESNDPVIFKALHTAYSLYNKALPVDEGKPIITMLSNSNKTIYVSRNGTIYSKNNSDTKPYDSVELKEEVPVNRAFIVSGEFVITSHENGDILLTDILTKKNYKMKGHTDLLRAAAYFENSGLFATGGRDNSVIIWKIVDSKVEKVREYYLNGRINTLAFAGNSVIAGTHNGLLYRLGALEDSKEIIYGANCQILSLAVSERTNAFIVGLLSGEVCIFSNNAQFVTSAQLSTTGIEHIALNYNADILAIATAEGKIRLYSFENITQTSLELLNNKMAINSLGFTANEKLYALFENGFQQYWLTRSEDYAKEINTLLTGNFTQQEWNEYVGVKVPYQNTKINQ